MRTPGLSLLESREALKPRKNILYSRFSSEDTADILRGVRRIYADLDGTCLKEGDADLMPGTLEYLRMLQEDGVEVTFVTGKPLEEVEHLMQSIPADLFVDVVYEKGAYQFVRSDGVEDDRYLLGSPETEQMMDEVRTRFSFLQPGLEQEYDVRIIPAGRGTHRMVLSIDIMQPDFDEHDALSRAELKVHDVSVLETIADALQRWISREFRDQLQLSDLGNGNFEIAPPMLNKTAAIQHITAENPTAGNVLFIGDSGNDEAMLRLSNKDSGTFSCLVHHERTPQNLLGATDFRVEGEANAAAMFRKIAQARGLANGTNIVATNTGPFRRRNDALELCEGMPVVFADLMSKSRHSAWVYVGNDSFDDVDHQLQGKIQNVPLAHDERESHYANISNQVLWPLAHKPEANARVHQFPEEDWLTYEQVCSKVATNISARLEKNRIEKPYSQTTLWIQDYQLLPVGQLLRRYRPQEDYNLGFYWHIPFPKVDVMVAELGEEKARKIVEWFSDYHLIGFHIDAYADNYLKACERFGIIPAGVLVQPISVNVEEIGAIVKEVNEKGHRFSQEALNEIYEVENMRNGTRRDVDVVLCGMERCDDTKACIERLEAWKILAQRSPEVFAKRKILEVVVPSRQEIPEYRERYEYALGLIQEINDILERKIGRRPVYHMPRINGRKDVMAAMALSNAVVVTPNKDGFNMSAAEASVVQMHTGFGHTLVSDQIGYYRSLRDEGLERAVDAITTTPEMGIKPDDIADAIERFFAEKKSNEVSEPRVEALVAYFRQYTLGKWVSANLRGIKYASMLREIEQVEK